MGTLESFFPRSGSVGSEIQPKSVASSPSPLPPPPPTQTLDGLSSSRGDSSDQHWLFEATAGETGDEISHTSTSSSSRWGELADNQPQSLAVVTDFSGTPDSDDQEPLLTISPTSSLCGEYGKPSLVGAGLLNLGNTCFLNVILQCFTHTAPLVQALYSYVHAKPCDCSGEQVCLLCSLWQHIEVSLSLTGKVVSPMKFVDNLSYFSSSFRRFAQEDAHEFLQCFLDRLERCSSNLSMKDISSSCQNDNLVKQIFGGRLVSKLRCCNCNHFSDTYEPSIDLSLEIDDANSLLTALESFTKVEQIGDAQTKFTCDNCKEEVSVEKQLMLDQAPEVYAFHLKRFKNEGSYVQKIDKHVVFPLELDLQPYSSSSQSNNMDMKYEVYAVVVHAAYTSSCGHYYCFIRSAPDTWYKFDDSKVTRVSEACVLSEEAYILFYARHGTPWFSSFMETIKPSLDPNLSTNSPKSVLDNEVHNATSPDVTNAHGCDVKENSEGADGLSLSTGSLVKYRRCHGLVEVRESNDNCIGMHIAVPLIGSHCSDQTQCNTENLSSPVKEEKLAEVQDPNITPKTPRSVAKVISSSALEDTNLDHNLDHVHDEANITPMTPIRSPGVDMSDEEPAELVFSANAHQLKLAEKASLKRQATKDPEDLKKIEAYKQCRKMHGKRGEMLIAAMHQEVSKSEGSVNKRRKRIVSPKQGYSHSSDRRKPFMF